MTPTEIFDVLCEVKFRSYKFILLEEAGHLLMHAHFEARCIVTGKTERQFTRQWLLDEKMSKSDIVATALKCVLTSEEHEAREDFQYRGQNIFGPHFNVDALHALSFAHNPPTINQTK